MNPKKIKILEAKTKEELFALDRKAFTKSECQEIIDETRLSKLDRDIANLKVIDCMNFEDISMKLFIDKRTVIKHWKDTSIRLKTTIVQMFYKGKDLY